MPEQHNIEYKQKWHYLINFAIAYEEVKLYIPEFEKIISKVKYEAK